MAITIVGTAQSGANTNGNDVTLTFDGSPAEDDYVLVIGGHGDQVTTLSDPGSGYTQIYVHTGTAPIWGAWYKKLGASPDASVVCSGGGNAADGVAYCSWVLRGVDPDNFLDVAYQMDSDTTTNPDPPSITPSTTNAAIFVLAGSAVNDANVTYPTGYTTTGAQNNGNDTNDLTTAGARKNTDWTSGAEDPASFTAWSGGAWRALTIAIRPLSNNSPASGTATLATLTASGTAGNPPLTASGTVNLETLTSSGLVRRYSGAPGKTTAEFVIWTSRSRRHLRLPQLPWAGVAGTKTASGSPSLEALTASGTVTQQQVVTGSATLEVLTASGTVTQQQVATGSPSLEALTASGTVTQQQVVTGTATLEALTASGVVNNALMASGTPSVPTLTASGTIVQVYKPSGTVNLEALTATGTVTQQQVVTGTATLAELTASGTASLGGLEASGTPNLEALTASGTVTQEQVVTGSASVPTLTASGTVTQEQVVTGSASVPTLTASGTAKIFSSEAPGHYTASFVIRWSDSRKHQQWIKPPSTPLSPTQAERAGYFPASRRVEASRFSFERHHLQPPHPAEYPASDAPPAPSFAAWDLRGWLSQLDRWKEVGQYLQLNALAVFKETDPNYYSGWGMAFATTPRAFRTSFRRQHQSWPMPESFPATPTTEAIVPAYFAPKQHRRHERRKVVHLPRLDEHPRTIQSAAAYAPVKTIKRRETARILQFPLELNSRPQTPPVAEQPMTSFLSPVQFRRHGRSKLRKLEDFPDRKVEVFPVTTDAVNHVWYWDRYAG